MTDPTVRMEMDEVEKLVFDACFCAGANLETCHSLVRAILSAEGSGNKAVGLDHLPDYLIALREGRLNGHAQPELSFPAPALLQVDARGGIAQLGFDRAFDELTTRAATFGIALLSLHGTFSAGELGYYPLRLAKPALPPLPRPMAPADGSRRFARTGLWSKPHGICRPSRQRPTLADRPGNQPDEPGCGAAGGGTRRSAGARMGLDADGKPTTDAAKALKGALLALAAIAAPISP